MIILDEDDEFSIILFNDNLSVDINALLLLLNELLVWLLLLFEINDIFW